MARRQTATRRIKCRSDRRRVTAGSIKGSWYRKNRDVISRRACLNNATRNPGIGFGRRAMRYPFLRTKRRKTKRRRRRRRTRPKSRESAETQAKQNIPRASKRENGFGKSSRLVSRWKRSEAEENRWPVKAKFLRTWPASDDFSVVRGRGGLIWIFRQVLPRRKERKRAWKKS